VTRWAVVTGASRGIGAAIARRLSLDGFGVALVATNRSLLEELADELGEAEVHACDLADRGALAALATELRARHPELHALVNNAGIARRAALAEHEGWDEVLELDLRAPFALTRALLPSLRAGGASVVNIGSMGGELGTSANASYAAAKGGLHQLTRALAVELGPERIRVNTVSPGAIRTDMFERAHSAERQRALADSAPLRRVGTPEEVAAAVSFLCSDDAAFVTGATLPVDGGLAIRLALPRELA
jgi:3-oxoacyl-[acyl-carrier protein] reductase